METEVVVDTETTGLKVNEGHRIVEVGIVEIRGYSRTGRSFHRYLNPERSVSPDAHKIHGLNDEFLSDKPLFSSIANEFLEFIGNSKLVIHHASFDMGFINRELELASCGPIPSAQVLDTLQFAREELPRLGGHSLDALCRHYRIDLAERKERHGALVDADLLAEVYFRLKGGGQGMLDLLSADPAQASSAAPARVEHKPRPNRLLPLITKEEEAAHAEFVKSLGPNALWNRPRAGAANEP